MPRSVTKKNGQKLREIRVLLQGVGGGGGIGVTAAQREQSFRTNTRQGTKQAHERTNKHAEVLKKTHSVKNTSSVEYRHCSILKF